MAVCRECGTRGIPDRPNAKYLVCADCFIKPKRRAVLPVNKPRVHKVKTKVIPRKQKYKEDE